MADEFVDVPRPIPVGEPIVGSREERKPSSPSVTPEEAANTGPVVPPPVWTEEREDAVPITDPPSTPAVFVSVAPETREALEAVRPRVPQTNEEAREHLNQALLNTDAVRQEVLLIVGGSDHPLPESRIRRLLRDKGVPFTDFDLDDALNLLVQDGRLGYTGGLPRRYFLVRGDAP